MKAETLLLRMPYLKQRGCSILSEMEKLNEKIDNKMNELGKVFMDFLPAITSLFEMVVSTALSQSNVKAEMKQQLINQYTEKLKMITQPILVILKSFAERIQRSPDFGKNNNNGTGITSSSDKFLPRPSGTSDTEFKLILEQIENCKETVGNTSVLEVSRLIKKLKAKKSTGDDNIYQTSC
ncbi:unnamed protein product [Didymodactylos carnosus]|uniref:Uncharacterized protein n=1 Tax=Didymodactylos carnosus TaxID=1234261 RepID=A0A814W3V7_9BILA|nr:unnamed protein product [Didymodactylos carnosus]CAF3960301.1 unnamed protein product [Didymodactylos carnosus]